MLFSKKDWIFSRTGPGLCLGLAGRRSMRRSSGMVVRFSYGADRTSLAWCGNYFKDDRKFHCLFF